MKRFWIILAFVLCGSFSTESAMAETDVSETCWSKFWTRYEQIENQIKRSCRECTERWYGDRIQPDYGLTCLANSEPSSHESIVVFVHGFNSRPEDLKSLVRETQQAGFRCVTFRYPNDQSLTKSARFLAEELASLKGRLAVVTHSMGGLIVREAIENPELDPGNVRQLIQITPPNHGTQLARFAVSMDVVEYLMSEDRRQESGFIYGSILDGLAEASDDMSPDSEFLQTLNSRPRHPDVQYTLVLGTDAPIDPTAFAATRRCVSWLGNRWEWVDTAKTTLKSHLTKFDELIDGRGDGIVSVRRARLSGVTDLIVGQFDHADLLSEAPNPAARKAREQILKRLQLPLTHSD